MCSCSLKKALNYPFALNVYSVLYCSLISCFFFFDALVARRLTLDKILSLHHCKLISWQVHLPEFWLKSINLMPMNFILKKKTINFELLNTSHRNTSNSSGSQFPSFYRNQVPHHTSRTCTSKTDAVQIGRGKASLAAISPTGSRYISEVNYHVDLIFY